MHGHITVDAGAAAEAVVGGAICEIHLFHIAAGKILSAFDDFHHTGAALTDATTVVEVIEALVGVDTCRESSLAKIRSLDATDLLAFLLKTDGGHGSFTCWARTNLQASGPLLTHLQRIHPEHRRA